MSAQGLWINTPLMVPALGIGLVLRDAGQRPGRTRGVPSRALIPWQAAVPRQAACAERSADGPADGPGGGRAGGSELTDMIDASEPESCPACGAAPERGCECDAVESARLLAGSF